MEVRQGCIADIVPLVSGASTAKLELQQASESLEFFLVKAAVFL